MSTSMKKSPGRGRRTWFRIQYIVWIMMAAIGYLFYQNYALFVCLFVLLVLPIYSYFSMKKLAKSLEVSLSFANTICEENSTQNLTVTTSNKSIFPAANVYYRLAVKNFYYANEECYELNLPLYALRHTEASLHIEAKHCGMLQASLQEFYICDMCNLFIMPVQLEEKAELFILPPKEEIEIDIEYIKEGAGEDEEMNVEKGDDPSILLDIRSYIPGDRMQRVHWKLTARQDELMVKEYGEAKSRDIHILLELYGKEVSPAFPEAVIRVFYSLGLAFLATNNMFSVSWWDAALGEIVLMPVGKEDDLYEALWRMYVSRPYTQKGAALENYSYEYDRDKVNCFYLSLEEECTEAGAGILYRLEDGMVIACF